MNDPFLRMADEWDRDDGLDALSGETKQEMVERWDRQYPSKFENGDKARRQEAPETNRRLQWLDMSGWDNEPIQNRKWAIKDRVPLNQAGLFSGEGGTGKSIIELTKNVAHVLGKDWFGSLPEMGPAIYLGAEDDADELHIRIAAIASHYGATFNELSCGGLHILCLLGQDATLCAMTRSGRVETTGLYKQMLLV
jgi:hypothetical protein